MKQLALALVCLTMTAGSVASQALARGAPASTLLYFYSHEDDPIAAINKFTANPAIWSNPVDLQDGFMEAMDQGMAMLEGIAGIPVGSASGFLKSITTTEGALYSVTPTDSMPEFEFALRMETPRAKEIYDLVSGKLLEEAIGEQLGENETEFFIGDAFSANVGLHGDSIILASSSVLLNQTITRMKGAGTGGLASTKAFQRALGNEQVPNHCAFVNLKSVINTWKDDWMEMGRGSQDFTVAMDVIQTLGLFDLEAVGYVDTDQGTRISLTSQKPIPAFEIMDAGKRAPMLLHLLPADVAFGMEWCGRGSTLWRNASGFVLDGEKFPMAAMAEEHIRSFQKLVGLKAEEMAELADGGGSFGFIPDEHGRLDDDEEHFILTLRPSSTAKAEEMINQIATNLLRRRGGEVEMTQDGDVTRFRMLGEKAGRAPELAVYNSEILIAAKPTLDHVLGCRKGTHPTLATYAATQGLPQQASAYMYVGLKTIMMQDDNFSSAYGMMRDGAGVAAAVTVGPDEIVLQTNKPLPAVIGAFAGASSIHQAQRGERKKIRRELANVAEAYAAYRTRTGKSPPNLAALNLTGDKALKYPGQGSSPKPYKLIDLGTGDFSERASDTIVCTMGTNKYGRLVGLLSGGTRSLSEARFRRMIKNQRGQ